jgi:hypothetical protein
MEILSDWSSLEIETYRGEHPLHRLEEGDVSKVPSLREIFEIFDIGGRVGGHHSEEGQQT